MTDIFLGFLNRSLAAGILILAVVLVRLVFKKAPRWLLCALWALAAVRLVCPVSVESVLSLIPSAEPVQPEIIVSAQPAITSGIPVVDAIVNPPLAAAFTPSPVQSANPLQIWAFLAACVWLAGIAALLLYAGISALRLRLRVRTAVRLEQSVYQSEFVPSPFILGVLRPRIYLPFGLEPDAQEMVLAHERAHLRRGDQLWKPLGYLLLAHSFSGEIGAPIVMIDELYLIPEARGHHIGRAILETLSAYYRDKAGALKLECTPENQVAMRLYQSLGFRPLPYTAMVWELPTT